MKAYIVDTETTGIADDSEVVEMAWISLGEGLNPTEPVTYRRYRPEGAMSFGALATHHILPSELEDRAPSYDAKLPADCTYMIGHNVDFDWKMLGHPEVKRIDTLPIARRLWPDCDSHSQSALYYYLFGATEKSRERLRNAHSAVEDVLNLVDIFGRILEASPQVVTVADLYALSEACRIPTHMTFGKHKGLPIEDVPKSYVSWYARQDNPDPYLLKAFKKAGL